VLQRRAKICEILDEQGASTYQQLADVLNVSTMTIRRDVDELADEGRLIKTLGGAQRANAPSSLYETTLGFRLQTNRAEKRAIAAAAVELIANGQTLFLDGGTTCIEVAKLLARSSKDVTVVTNSALVSLEVGQSATARVLAIGGQFDAASASFVGPSSEDWAGRFFVDLAIVSTKAFVANEGTFESSTGTFRIKQIIANQASTLVLLVDHTKFGKRALCRVLDVAQIGTIITDDRAPAADLDALRAAGKKVIVAGVSSPKMRRSVAHAT
jgi:DeoR family fructose operon transcriptional repressor